MKFEGQIFRCPYGSDKLGIILRHIIFLLLADVTSTKWISRSKQKESKRLTREHFRENIQQKLAAYDEILVTP